MKLSKLTNTFSQNHLADAVTRQLADFEVLRAILPEAFPDVDRIATLWPPMRDDEYSKIVSPINLPLHTRDDAWLALYLIQTLKFSSPYPFQAPRVKYANAKEFVKIDPEFGLERNRYEQDVVKFLIKELMHADQNPNSLKAHTQAIIRNSFAPDMTFYDTIMKTATRYGLDEDCIKNSLEINADLWREANMNLAFDNQCLRPIWEKQGQLPFDQYQTMLNQVSAHRHNFVAMREYQYYQTHHAVIDALNLATDNMKMPTPVYTQNQRAWNERFRTITKPLEQFTAAARQEREI